ncbi:MucBP domain-containing protein [Listeria ilorinensis]|uniref:MucBP domain-containing protein n=1 Tax=Listeria ilorinensis TaxID=2867439 RepID=UPI001EF3D962|nr:MucBP domain-containing protein [Listeria ilorinensis]
MNKKIILLATFVLLLTNLLPVTQVVYASGSWLYETMDENQIFVNDIVTSYNKEHGTKLTEQDFTQETLNQLHNLTISINSSLPDKFQLMPNLTTIYAAATGITTIPNSIGTLQYLKELNWNQNGLTEFPTIVLGLPQLEELYINGGTIDSIPAEISQLMDTLTSFDIRFNQLVTLPEELFEGQHLLSLITTNNQIVSDVPSSYLDSYNEGNNLLEHAPTSHQTQDQLVYKGGTLRVSVGTDFSQLVPDKSDLGLRSGRTLFAGHQFEYYDDGKDAHIVDGVATTPGKAEIYIKSSFSTTTNSYAKVKIPVIIEEMTEGQVTVNYLDENGTKIADSDVLTGTIGDNYSTTAKNIEGYELSETPSNATGKYTIAPITVNYSYKKTEPVAQTGSVTVQYLDEEGQMLAPNETLTGEIGTSYETTAKTINGYQLEELPVNATGEYTVNPQMVTYVYKKEITPILSGTVTVKYQDEEGNRLLPDEILTGETGTAYQTFAKTIDGYTLIQQPANATGIFNDQNQNVFYVYQKNEQDTDIPISPSDVTPITSQPTVEIATNQEKSASDTLSSLVLPKTGDQNKPQWLLGLTLISGAGALLWMKGKRK